LDFGKKVLYRQLRTQAIDMTSKARQLYLAKLQNDEKTKKMADFIANAEKNGAGITRVENDRVVYTSDPKHTVGEFIPPPERNTIGEVPEMPHEGPAKKLEDTKAAIAALVDQYKVSEDLWTDCTAIEDLCTHSKSTQEAGKFDHMNRFPTVGNPVFRDLENEEKEILFTRDPESLDFKEIDYLRACQYHLTRLVWYLKEVRKGQPRPAAPTTNPTPTPATTQTTHANTN
jgi:hypothetical protein